MLLSDEAHERLWRICDALVTGAGARAAMVCDPAGMVVVTVGNFSAQGTVTGVELLGPGERLVKGEAGNVYGAEIPGGALLAVLHDPSVLEQVRRAAIDAVRDAAALLASLPPPPPAPTEHEHPHAPRPAPTKPSTSTRTTTKSRTKTRTRTGTKPPPKKQKGPARTARPSAKKPKKKKR